MKQGNAFMWTCMIWKLMLRQFLQFFDVFYDRTIIFLFTRKCSLINWNKPWFEHNRIRKVCWEFICRPTRIL